jgi:hypothetical protein
MAEKWAAVTFSVKDRVFCSVEEAKVSGSEVEQYCYRTARSPRHRPGGFRAGGRGEVMRHFDDIVVMIAIASGLIFKNAELAARAKVLILLSISLTFRTKI